MTPERHYAPWTPEEDRRLAELLSTGESTLSQLADRMGRTAAAVKQRMVFHLPAGLRPRREKYHDWTVSEERRVVELAAQGATMERIGRQMGLSHRVVADRLYSIRRRDAHERA